MGRDLSGVSRELAVADGPERRQAGVEPEQAAPDRGRPRRTGQELFSRARGDIRACATSSGCCGTAGSSTRLRTCWTSTRRQGKPEAAEPHIGPRQRFGNRQERDEFLAEIWANSSVLLDRLCRGSGIAYYHFLQPNQYLAGSKPILEEEKRTAILEGHPYGEGVERGYPILIRLGERLRGKGVAYHDLTGIFAGHAEPIYIDNCCHYNQAGYDIMADAIARAIRGDPAK